MLTAGYSTDTWSPQASITSPSGTGGIPAPGGTSFPYLSILLDSSHPNFVCGLCRFFAATELKAMLAHILINYDVKAEVDGVRPSDQFFGMHKMPNSQGKIFIRRR